MKNGFAIQQAKKKRGRPRKYSVVVGGNIYPSPSLQVEAVYPSGGGTDGFPVAVADGEASQEGKKQRGRPRKSAVERGSIAAGGGRLSAKVGCLLLVVICSWRWLGCRLLVLLQYQRVLLGRNRGEGQRLLREGNNSKLLPRVVLCLFSVYS